MCIGCKWLYSENIDGYHYMECTCTEFTEDEIEKLERGEYDEDNCPYFTEVREREERD